MTDTAEPQYREKAEVAQEMCRADTPTRAARSRLTQGTGGYARAGIEGTTGSAFMNRCNPSCQDGMVNPRW